MVVRGLSTYPSAVLMDLAGPLYLSLPVDPNL